jgi:protein required for attachment to host cells
VPWALHHLAKNLTIVPCPRKTLNHLAKDLVKDLAKDLVKALMAKDLTLAKDLAKDLAKALMAKALMAKEYVVQLFHYELDE